MSVSTFSTNQFARAFVSHLVELGATAIYPKSKQDRRGFWAVMETLNARLSELRSAASSDERALYRALVLIRNELQASNTGAFDNLETALRNLQLNFTNCPNPDYEEIAFTISRPFAQAILQELPTQARTVAVEAAEQFHKVRSAA